MANFLKDSPLEMVDLLVLASYFITIIAAALYSRSKANDVENYFKSGGALFWWSAGTSAFVVNFNAFAFSGAAAKYYETGLLFLVVAALFQVTYVLLYFYAHRFPRLRVVTGLEIVKLRFGVVTESLFAVYRIPIGIMLAGIGLAVTGTFFAAAIGVSVPEAILWCGVATVLMSATGGSWAIVASDFVQGLIMLVAVAALLVHMVLTGPFGGIQGIGEAIQPAITKLPQQLNDPTLLIWISALLIYQLIIRLNLIDEGSRFLLAKNEKECRRIVLMLVVMTSLAIPILAIPPIACAGLAPDLATAYPMLKNPQEAATLWVASESLPSGTFGLFLAGVLASAMTTMDTGLNKNVGFFVVNVYRDKIRASTTERELVIISRITSLIFGTLIIAVALLFEHLRTVNLFDQTLRINSLVVIPLAVPLGLGLVFTKTPQWSGWSSGIVGVVVALLIENLITADTISEWLGSTGVNSLAAASNLKAATNIIGSVLAATAWYLMTAFTIKDKCKVTDTEFNRRIHSPIQDVSKSDGQAEQMMWFGKISFVFSVLLVFSAISAPTSASLISLLLCALPILLLSISMMYLSRRSVISD